MGWGYRFKNFLLTFWRFTFAVVPSCRRLFSAVVPSCRSRRAVPSHVRPFAVAPLHLCTYINPFQYR